MRIEREIGALQDRVTLSHAHVQQRKFDTVELMPRSGGIRIEDHFPGGIKLDDPLTVLAAFEAFIGLLIEVTFIATFTRRLFGQ